MSVESKATQTTAIDVIRNEVAAKANTKGRVSDRLQAIVDSFIHIQDIKFVAIDTSVSPITLDFNNLPDVMFNGAANITTNKVWQLANAGAAVKISSLRFKTNAGIAHQWPSTFRMFNALWDLSTHTWTPLDAGEYEANASFNGTTWRLTIEGPF